jgi:S-DNA-T family DNA segregation ATPase FtsK/SpoIIIE
MAKGKAATDVKRVSVDPWYVQAWHALTRQRRLWRDVAGLLLMAVGLITLVTLVGLNTGSLIKRWAEFVGRGLGLGAFVLCVVLIGFGLAMLLGFKPRFSRPVLIRVICGEIAFVAFLALVHNFAFGSQPYELMQSGGGGGAVGWVLSEALWRVLGSGGPEISLLSRLFSIVLWLAITALTAWVAIGPFLVSDKRLAISDKPEALAWEPEATTRGGKGKQLPLPDPSELPIANSQAPTKAPSKEKPAQAEKPTRPLQPIAEIKSNAVIIKEGEANVLSPTGKKKADEKSKPKPYVPRPETLPPMDLLKNAKASKVTDADVQRQADMIETTLAHFGLAGKVVEIRRGPTVTQFGVEPGYLEKPGVEKGEKRQQKVRVGQIAALQNDFALALSAQSLRIEAPIPGRGLVGIEVPNVSTSMVDLKSLMQGEDFRALSAKTPLAFALGRDVSGGAVNADLGRMPHVLIAGTTGSGKSVCISAITVCLAMNNRPEDLKLVMVDPKMVELTRFAGLPHIIGKPESEMDRIPAVLRWVTKEMDDRYKKFAQIGSRNLAEYNESMKKRDEEPLPRIVLMIDELADLMMQSPIETEKTLCRLAQMARATGIHMVVATQRPSVDVVTGLIKANFPARIAFSVASGMDSRVILDQVGAESLLGRGDMLFQNPELGTPMRVQGCFVSDKEVEKLIEWWKKQSEIENEELGMKKGEPQPEAYVANKKPELDTPWETAVAELMHERQMASAGRSSGRGGGAASAGDDDGGGDDDLVKRAMDIIATSGSASTSLLQRKLRIGYPRAARLMEELQEMGYVGGASKQAGKGRDVRAPAADED